MHSPSPTPSVVIFGSARPVTCAVMDYAYRLVGAVNALRPGLVAIRTIEPEHPAAFIGAIAEELRRDRIVHLQMPIEGWGNSIVPGSALMAARLMTRKGRIAITLHEWASLNHLRYLSMVPDILACDGFVLVSQQQRESFQKTPLVSAAKKLAAPVIPIGPNIMPARIDPERVAAERVKLRGSGASEADVVIGYFGVLYASKRPDVLLRTTKALHQRGVKARLLICGDFLWDKPGDREAFLALASELGVADWLDFRGRIDDEGELMATLSAADVFLLPFTDGISTRRGSFQAVSQLAVPLVSTEPEQQDEFALAPALKAKIDNPATVLCPVDAAPERFAEAILAAQARKAEAIGVDLARLWDEAALAHLSFYDGLKAPA
ncbi:glycosyltransferase [Bosea sp. (in: a-proteobacteria)]|jgi:glycosyltransferase involved in cell wall biosynthesis|uniref:glycosyltransferase n=1 Tax=Bosea sp. (in: a-proteobacteria) TaxID=1871050 RepID=UPI002DDD17F5|nr:glycosyltransferase [Bosea sp. (in: a-proteobacteria)]HEV2509766.1 glycosyltransferase [Bosea sp. (in: a-proteobacteria)]